MQQILGHHAKDFVHLETRCQGVFVCLNEKCTFRDSYSVAHQAVGITRFKKIK